MVGPVHRAIQRPLAALSLACLAGFGCDFGEDVAKPVHASFELRPGPDDEHASWLGDESVVTGVIVLEPVPEPDVDADADGDAGREGEEEGGERMAGAIVLTGTISSTVVVIGARYGDGVITLDDGSTYIPDHEAQLSWDRFELVLEDLDGDGWLDAGSGTFDGELDSFVDRVTTTTDITGGEITAEPDTRDAVATASSSGRDRGRLFPYDGVRVRFNKPVRANDVVDKLVLLVDGEVTEASVTPVSPVDMPDRAGGSPVSVTAMASVVPAAPIPLGTEVGVEVAGIRDVSAREVKGAEPVDAAADLGSALSNLDFAQDFDRWHRIGAIELREQFEGAEPAAADRFVVLTELAQLVAELDLPEDAESITMAFTGFVDTYPEIIGTEISAEIVHANGEQLSDAVPGRVTEDGMIECEQGCSSYLYRTAPIPLELDVREAAGERVFLRVTVSANGYAAAVEDLRLHSTGGED